MNNLAEHVTACLRQAYTRLIIPENDGTFRAEILEFPGCFAVGRTAAEALMRIEDAAHTWLSLVIEAGQSIPTPVDNTTHSGRIGLRVPISLHRTVAILAHREHVDVNSLITVAITEYVGKVQGRCNK